MKFHAMALCLAGTLVAGGALAQDTRTDMDRMHNEGRVDHSSWPTQKPFVTSGKSSQHITHTQYFPFYKEDAVGANRVAYDDMGPWTYYTDLPPLSDVAAKVTQIHDMNAREASEVRALATRASALGWSNIAAVYNQIASDHQTGATVAANWLTENHFTVPAEPATAAVADTMSEADVRNSVDRLLDEHIKEYNETLDKLHSEKSSTVRGLYLMNLAAIQQHITWLQELQHDISSDRRDLSARLSASLDSTRGAHSLTEWNDMIINETWAQIQTTPPTEAVATAPYVVPPDAQPQIVEKPVIIERIVERPAPPPAPVTVTPAPAPQPVITPAPRTNVAGERQIRAQRTRRHRRPAK